MKWLKEIREVTERQNDERVKMETSHKQEEG
jgi:hypothetical protein